MSGEPSRPPTLPTVAAVLADPAASRPLRQVLREWSQRDPIDAANDAELLAAVLGRRADEILTERMP